MSFNLPIRNWSEIPDLEKNIIFTRKTLNLENIIDEIIKPMVDKIIANPIKALEEYSLKFDGFVPSKWILDKNDIQIALEQQTKENPDLILAFKKAYDNIYSFHSLQKPQNIETQIASNLLGFRFQPFDSACLYVPGGKALYPSTVIMGITPASIAGVENLLLSSPANSESKLIPPIIQAVASLAGCHRLFQAGGAQAILIATLGCPELNISPVDFIYGPGNIYVAAAKAYVAGRQWVGIDSFAGPSEVLIIADNSAEPHFLAHDLLAQAEHDEDARAILLSTDQKILESTNKELEKAINKRSNRSNITRSAMEKNGQLIKVDSIKTAIAICNRYAPEHLEIQTAEDQKILKQIKAAGSVFVGKNSPVAIGDYYSGTNHILPTGGSARFSSGVSVHSFYRRITWQKISSEGILNSVNPITLMSKSEGLFEEHGYSILARTQRITEEKL